MTVLDYMTIVGFALAVLTFGISIGRFVEKLVEKKNDHH